MSATKEFSPESVMVIGGPASVELIDREGHMITNDALSNAFKKYMDNFRTRNAMVLHSDVQVGWALPAYITRGGQIYKSGVGNGVSNNKPFANDFSAVGKFGGSATTTSIPGINSTAFLEASLT